MGKFKPGGTRFASLDSLMSKKKTKKKRYKKMTFKMGGTAFRSDNYKKKKPYRLRGVTLVTKPGSKGCRRNRSYNARNGVIRRRKGKFKGYYHTSKKTCDGEFIKKTNHEYGKQGTYKG